MQQNVGSSSKYLPPPNWCPLILPHTRLYGKSPTLYVVEEHPPQTVCDYPHVLFEYDVKLSPVGQL